MLALVGCWMNNVGMANVKESLEIINNNAKETARACATLQRVYNPGVPPEAYARTALLFGSIAAGAIKIATQVGGDSATRRLSRYSIGAIGVTAGVLTALDVVTYAGMRLDRDVPEDYDHITRYEPPLMERVMDSQGFQDKILDSAFPSIRGAGIGLVIGHAFLRGGSSGE